MAGKGDFYRPVDRAAYGRGYDRIFGKEKNVDAQTAALHAIGQQGTVNPLVVYVSGPMTGRPYHNYPEFNMVAEHMRELGFAVLNPAETAGGNPDIERGRLLAIDIGYIQQADYLVLLEGWRESKGANLEVAYALSVGKRVFDYDEYSGLGMEHILDKIQVATFRKPVYGEEE